MFYFFSLIPELLVPSSAILFVLLVCLPLLTLSIFIYICIALYQHFAHKCLRIKILFRKIIFILILTCLLTPLVAYSTTLYRIHSAKEYLEGIIPILTQYKSEHGKYPLSVEYLSLPSGTPPFLVRNHFGFTNCSAPHMEPSDKRWYCPLNLGEDFQLSFGYEDGMDERPSYHRESSRTWECEGVGCITDHR